MGMAFKKATKASARLRAALIGPSGSGKTYTALSIASGLGKKIAVIDTERGSASKYADDFAFDVLELESFEPDTYVQAIASAAAAGYDVLIIDSLSHAWSGKGGALEQVDTAAKRSRTGSSFAAWRDVTPMHNRMVDAILRAPMHIVATMRAKTEFVQEKDERTGKMVPRKIGLAPVQRDGVEYEFDVVADIDADHNLIVSKTRCKHIADKVFHKAGEEFAATLRAWLGDGPVPQPTRDERQEPEPVPYYPEPSDPPAWRDPDEPVPSVVDSFADLINACRTEEHLAAVAADIKRAVKSEQDKAALVTVWKARREAIRSEAA